MFFRGRTNMQGFKNKILSFYFKLQFQSKIVHSLIKAYGLLSEPNLTVIAPRKANESELELFHSSDYIDYIKALPRKETDLIRLQNDVSQKSIKSTDSFDISTMSMTETSYEEDNLSVNDEDLEFGIGYDCPKFDSLLDFLLRISGGTLTAAEAILTDKADIAINWCGGWHHAQRDSASGFCYVNDIVLGIQKLTEKFKRIMYIDLDVHHGDGVENAFCSTQRVLTLSFHINEAGFFPGSGGVESCGIGKGKGYSINAPYKFNIAEQFIDYFKAVFEIVHESYMPEVFVVQLGADVLAGDPLGEANLTVHDMVQCLNSILSKKGPKILLGGGGYDPLNASKYWTSIMALICNKILDEDIPDHDYFLNYGPCYTMQHERKALKDLNTKEDLIKVQNRIKGKSQRTFISQNFIHNFFYVSEIVQEYHVQIIALK